MMRNMSCVLYLAYVLYVKIIARLKVGNLDLKIYHELTKKIDSMFMCVIVSDESNTTSYKQ